MKRLMDIFFKKISFIAAAGFSVLMIGGCWDRMEINDLAIVTAAGIDKSEDGQIELTLEIFIPKSGGGQIAPGGGSQGGKTTMIFSHKGVNMADALSKHQAELPRKVFWGACKVLIFGEEAAKDGVQDHLDFLLRHPGPRERSYVFVSEGKAKKVIELKAVLERYSAEELREIADMAHGMEVTLQDMDEMLVARDKDLALPYLKIEEEKSKGGSFEHAVIAGTALFKKDQFVGSMSESTARGLLWLRNELKEYTISMKPEGTEGELIANPVTTKTRLDPKIKGDEWTMVIHVKTEGTVAQNTTSLELDSPKSLKVIEKAFRKRVKGRMEQAIEEAQEMNVDVIHYGQEFRRKYPKQWKKVEAHWDEKFPEVKTEIHVEANIRRQGFIDHPVKKETR